jgi:hypothetical protein
MRLIEMSRVRQVISRSPCRVVYKFPSIKLGKMVYCESGLELDFAFLLDADHAVISFQEQPGKIEYYLNAKLHTYTPDFLVQRSHKKQIVEVKPKSKISTEENRILFEIISAICREASYEFMVVTDADMRKGARLSNVRLLWKYGRTLISPKHHIYCQEFFSYSSEAALGEIIAFFARRHEGKDVVFSLLYWGVVGVNIDLPITVKSPVHLPAST